ncbi:hypothetical protein QVO32_15420 [Bacteroides gallinaceum]|uniref:hypothetical protein n=1 Tax=Bacteroides gallinaceum TaxID=1462571 RepID=UPI0025AA5D7B|nr:hypothetical protein [Bacteroides gallinaceum]MDN0080779.1 hypothetical protein [Bacteroides gallinaceum]
MKTRNKLYDKSRLHLLCLLTALLGLFGAGQTWAGNPTTLTVGGTNALNGGYWLTNADGTLTEASADNYNVYYDGNGTLTLKDATINGTNIIGHVGAGIYAEGDLTIVLEGSSTVTGVQDPNDESQSIRVSGNLTIQGGSLTAQGAETSSGSSYGIFVTGSFTQQSGIVTAIGGNVSENYSSEGLYVYGGTVTVERGTLTATGGNTSGSSYGIYARGTVTVGSAAVTATGGSGNASYGLYIDSASPSVNLSDNGSLTARSESADRAGGIYVLNLFGSAGAVTVGDNSTLLANSVILYDNSFIEKPLAPTGNGSWLIYGQSNQTSAVGGSYTLTDNLTIESGNTLTIPAGSTLTIPNDKTLTVDNANQLVVNGELVLEGTFDNAKELEGSGNLVLGEITLTDDEGISEYAGYHLKLKSKKVTYVRALSDNSQYGTICLPFVPTSVAGGQVTYYQVSELESDEITLVETDFEAGKPLFYRTSGTGDITFSAESAAGVELVTTPATDSFMEGTMSVATPTAGYFLKNGNFYPIANGDKVKVKSFRAYVKGQNDASQASVMSVNVARP